MTQAGGRSAKEAAGHLGRVLWGAAIVAYLVAMAVCTATHHPLAAALLLAALLAATCLRALIARHQSEAAFIGANLTLVLVVLALWSPVKALGLTLAIAEAFVGALFLRSLGGRGRDLVTRIACAIQPDRSARVRGYTRAVSWSWAALMFAMAAISLAFTFTASPRLWEAWRLVGSWAVPVGFFALEWLVRHWFLRREPQPGFRRTLQALPRIDYPQLFRL